MLAKTGYDSLGMQYWAHSDPEDRKEGDPQANWQPLREHLCAVAALAEQFSQQIRPDDLDFARAVRAAGLLHDYGKYTREFQERIRGVRKGRAPHSIHGASLAFERQAVECALAIAGHHAGLPNPKGDQRSLWERVRELGPVAEEIWETAVEDCASLKACRSGAAPLLDYLRPPRQEADLATRMLFSCLIDADRLDTAAHMTGQPNMAEPSLNAAAKIEQLLEFIQRRAAGVPEGAVKAARQEVLDSCLTAAGDSSNLFSLNVPTGGGKTLASMAFALKRAQLDPGRFKRVIVVIPYLSIIEQNAQVYAAALGSDTVFEHHSGRLGRLNPKPSSRSDSGDVFAPASEDDSEGSYLHPRRRVIEENWSAPIIVTTSVRFFESLFSNRPGDLRRLHNVAGSIVILDEVQTLPRQLLAPILGMIEELSRDWSTTFLFCTATLPAFEKSSFGTTSIGGDLRWPRGTLREVIPQPQRLFDKLRRVRVRWPEDHKTSAQELASQLIERRRVLCIVNTRDRALGLFRTVLATAAEENVAADCIFHLSTRMCAAHRLEVLDEVREQIARDKAPCLVISTQLVEAGVDLDFPCVFREMAPLDSIAQAAGRCDREGRLTAASGTPGGEVIVFEPDEATAPPGYYREATARTRALAAERELSIDSPDDIRAYFDRLYGEAGQGQSLVDLRDSLKFRTLAEEFDYLADHTQAVFTAHDATGKRLLQRLRGQLRGAGFLDRKSLYQLRRRYSVGLRPNEMQTGLRGAIEEITDSDPPLFVCREGFYDRRTGIRLELAADQLVV